MAENSKTFGLGPDKLAQLLDNTYTRGQNVSLRTGAEEKADALHACLSETWPNSSEPVSSLQDILKRLSQDLPPKQGECMGYLLCNPKTSIETLKSIKEASQHGMAETRSQVTYEILVVIYYSAIAAALVHSGQRITGYTRRELAQSLSSLIQRGWIPAKLIRLFEKARQICLEQE
jgi:hypothetical protein